MEREIEVGDIVGCYGEDSRYEGTVVAVFKKLNNKSVRYIVEDERGLLLIKGPKGTEILEPND